MIIIEYRKVHSKSAHPNPLSISLRLIHITGMMVQSILYPVSNGFARRHLYVMYENGCKCTLQLHNCFTVGKSSIVETFINVFAKKLNNDLLVVVYHGLACHELRYLVVSTE